MQLRFLLVTGPNKPDTELKFGPGLNVVYGGSNTGKSHMLKLIDYCLGAKNPPEPVPEQAGYDIVHLGIELDNGVEVTLVRALAGGEIRMLDGLATHRPAASEGQAISARHSGAKSLSKILLAYLNASGARIRTNAAGTTRELSFRDLEHNVIINEAKIQSELSPILSGQFTSKTAETSVFKYLITGVDDSAIDIAKPDSSQPIKQAAQLELLDKQIRDIETAIEEADQDQDELFKIDATLDQELARSFQVQERTEAEYRQLTSQRRELREDNELLADRISEIETLIARFELLSKHYEVDKKRLLAIAEAGQYFTLEPGEVCPVCGADPAQHRPQFACDGDVTDISAAAEAEASELTEKSIELRLTITNLAFEKAALSERIRTNQADIQALQGDIMREVPAVQVVRTETNGLMLRKISVQKDLELIRRREALLAQRAELGISAGYDSTTVVVQQQLDGTTLDSFSQVVENELKLWDFPKSNRVFFEIQKMDISVSGKSRAANGKGVRALLHGAFSVALMKYSRSKKFAHPGFLALDSLFVTYRDPADDADAEIASTPLKDKAFQAFKSLDKSLQLIIAENVDVPPDLKSLPFCTEFTGKAGVGRAGLFPPLDNE